MLSIKVLCEVKSQIFRRNRFNVAMCPISHGLRSSQAGDRMMFLLMRKLFNEIFSTACYNGDDQFWTIDGDEK